MNPTVWTIHTLNHALNLTSASQSAIPHPPREDCSGSLRRGSKSTALRADLRRCELWAWIVSHGLFSVPWYDYTGPFAALRLHPIIDASPLYDDESHLMSLAPQKATTDAYIYDAMTARRPTYYFD